MTGLFRRLARQVVGPEPPRLRPLAGLPFSPSPAFLDEASGDTSNAASAPSRRDHAPEPEAVGSIAPAPLASVEDDHDMGRSLPEPDMRHRRFGLADLERRDTRAQAPGAAARSNPDTPGLAARGGAAPVEPLKQAAPEVASAQGAGSTSTSGEVAGQWFPATLVGGMQVAPPTRFSGSASHDGPWSVQSRDRPAASGPAPDEVHVHIGRIEITAIQEPPRSKPRRRPDARPSELDAYLAQRARERS